MEYICFSLDQMNEAIRLCGPNDLICPACKENEFLPRTSDKQMIVRDEQPLRPWQFEVVGK